jgi:hypothetical protein
MIHCHNVGDGTEERKKLREIKTLAPPPATAGAVAAWLKPN